MCRKIIILIVGFLFTGISLKAGDIRIANMRGSWKFALGFKTEWVKADFNDNGWDEIFVPRNWEDQGFFGYDGFACYRKKIVIPETSKDKDLILSLGFIDDCDEVYFNGKLIGFSGSFPPNFYTAYNIERKYSIPLEYVNYGKPNVIVVKVYDDGLEGGIVNGEIGVFEGRKRIPFDIDLTGLWEFKLGDNAEYKKPQFNDSKWTKITVPKAWESQGYNDYDGFAWYRKSFKVSESLTKDRVVLMLGKIDDCDEVYINGNYIGLVKNLIDVNDNTRYNELRVFYISGNLFVPNKINILAVRVYDSGGWGGIYEGPVGIMNQKAFVQYWRSVK